MHRHLQAFLLLLLPGFIFAAEPSLDQMGSDLETIWEIQKDLAESSLSPDRSFWLGASLVSSGTLLSHYFVDGPLRRYLQDHRRPFFDTLFRIDDYYGDKYVTTAGVILLYTTGLISGEKNLRDAGILTIAAYIPTAIATRLLKQVFGRSRPFLEEGPRQFDFWPGERSRRSLPSGHTSSAFAISTVMAARSDNTVWKTAWYSVAALVGMARVYNDQHWFSDVLLGGAIGYGIGSFVANHAGSQETGDSDTSFRLYFSLPL